MNIIIIMIKLIYINMTYMYMCACLELVYHIQSLFEWMRTNYLVCMLIQHTINLFKGLIIN